MLHHRLFRSLSLCLASVAFAPAAFAQETAVNLTGEWLGLLSIAIFVVAYALVIAEETIHLKKSKPVMVAAGLIWFFAAIALSQHGEPEVIEEAVRHGLLEFVELFLFLLAAMTYINTMDERGVFDMLRAWLVGQGYSLRKIFWITGGLAFVISPVADNLTTALLMATVAMAVGGSNRQFVVLACINIVVAANSGGAFSPFGDITTLMVWQREHVEIHQFLALIVPSLANWLVTGALLSLGLPGGQPARITEQATLGHGAYVVIGLFVLTITMAVLGHSVLHLPPVVGMMTGLGLLKLFGYYLQKRGHRFSDSPQHSVDDSAFRMEQELAPASGPATQYDIYRNLQRAEWDTLMFFYGIMLCVGGLGTFGYLALASDFMYGELGATTANVLVGVLSALLDNIPVMFAVLEMGPTMDLGQWLLVTLTAGVGGSMLSVGSAAGVAVMGQARGVYTFFAHLKWTWAVVIGYAASIALHLWINAELFTA
jgi:Na+/H+ antiporter NhaD/arsenite permease-like protein